MRKMSLEEFQKILGNRTAEPRIQLREIEFEPMDLTGYDLSNMEFYGCSFQNVMLKNINFSNSSVENSLFDGCNLHGSNFENANMRTGTFRFCDMGECNIKGADLYGAVLESANLEGIVSDENTMWFRLYCPEEGAFLGYKKCVNNRLVQLLIPADAKRTSATYRCCRCNKAKVLTIKSFDYKDEFDEAWSLVDEDFVYRKGQWVEVKNFNEDRWYDSTTGIHFWLTRAEALAY